MFILQPDILFLSNILFYIAAAFFSLLLRKKHKICNILANLLCITGAFLGILASLGYIISDHEILRLVHFSTSIPLIALDLIIDDLTSFFVLGLSVLVLAVSLYSLGYNTHYYGKRPIGLFNFLYASFILSMFLVMTAGNTIFFFISWEIMSLLSYFLVVFESEKEENQKAGTLYIIMTHIGATFLLIAFMIMFRYTGSFDILGSSAVIPAAAKNIIFLLLLVGFGTKAGMIPLHIWLPYAHPASSSNVSALMSGIMIKTAIYGLIRFVLLYLNVQHSWWGILILCLGVISAVLGIAYALIEHDIKRLLAFSSIENIGIILIGLGVSFIAFAQHNLFVACIGLMAALFHTFNHMLFKCGLFLGAGAIQYTTHTKDINNLGGLIKNMPATSVFILCFSLAISAIVPFNGFVSEWLTYQSLFINIDLGHAGVNMLYLLAAAALALCGALAAVCFVKLFGISFLGLARSTQAAEAKEVPMPMLLGMGLLAMICLVLGIFPLFLLRIVDKVGLSFTGLSVTDHLQGGWLMAYLPLQVEGNSITPWAFFLALLILILISLVMVRILGGKYRERKYNTWDCGFKELTPRMQYSATGFSKPLRIVFKILYRPGRELKTGEGTSPYFPLSQKYQVSTESIFEKYLYYPIILIMNKFSIKTRLSIQTGSIHMYLLYILITTLALLLYNQLV
ncbi:formate hydrogenlyase [Dehalobacterium formicoaceticum]|uniref:Formate hydrogenlyase n=1 Tax=Dehalobacterium formicoaceticum TaxID=51515 RepID=A0ABT1Y1R4_9FIRM|nr:proton-conducting transporter membrane subunit [Dehalobacterium formicoaceticum]MCR6544803.1 formate hydrogenlyase [Dehalobacterium formicoaceticum]